MKKLMKQMKWDVILTSLLYVALGCVALLMPDTMVKTLGYMVGVFLIVAGAVSMICYLLRDAHQNYFRNDFVYGLVLIAIGIIVLYRVEWIVELVPMILGVLVVASGCRKLQDVIDMKRMEYGSWVLMLILAALNVVFGVVIILNPFETAVLLFQLIGVGLIVSGLTDCVTAVYFAGKIKRYVQELQAVDSTYTEVSGEREKNGRAGRIQPEQTESRQPETRQTEQAESMQPEQAADTAAEAAFFEKPESEGQADQEDAGEGRGEEQ